MLIGGAACLCTNFIDEYEWQSPQLVLFSLLETCALLGNRKVVFIGDSTNQQAASTLINAIRPSGALCHTQIYIALSDTLDKLNYGNLDRGLRMSEWVDELEPDIVIVSVGAHVPRNDTVYMNFVDKILHEMKEIETRKPSITFAWKTQSTAWYSGDVDGRPRLSGISRSLQNAPRTMFTFRERIEYTSVDPSIDTETDVTRLFST